MPAGALALLDAVPALPTLLGAAGGVNVAAATGAFASSLAGVLAQFPVAVGDGAAAATSIDPTATVAAPDSGAHDAPAPPTLVLLSTLTMRNAPTMARDAITGATPAPIPVAPTTAAPALLSDPGTAPASAPAPATQALPPAQLRSPPPNNGAGPAAAAAMQGPTAPATPPTKAAIGEPPQSVGDVSPALRSQNTPITLDAGAPPSPAVVSLPARRTAVGAPAQAATTSPVTSVPAMPVPGTPLPATPEFSATATQATPTPTGAAVPATASETATAATPPQAQESPPSQPSAQSPVAAPETAPSAGMAASRITALATKPKQSGVGAHDATAEKASAPPAEPGVATPPDATALVAILASQGGPPISPEPRVALAPASAGVDTALDPPAASQGTPALAASQTVAPPRPRPLSSTDTAMASPVATDLTAPPVNNPAPVQATATVSPDPQTTSAAAPASASASTTAGVAPAVTPPPHPAPAAQLAPVLLTLAGTATGSQHITLRLQPADLGTVQVRIDRPAEAPARVEISVSRPETLTLLLRDQTQLQRSLDQAGVPPEGRSVTFQLADQGNGSSFRQPDGFAQPDAPRHAAGADTAADDAAGTDARFTAGLAAPIVWRRAGLDITA